MGLRGFMIIYAVWMTVGVPVVWTTATALTLLKRAPKLPAFITNRLPGAIRAGLVAPVAAHPAQQVAPYAMPGQHPQMDPRIEVREDDLRMDHYHSFLYGFAVIFLLWAAVGLGMTLIWWGAMLLPSDGMRDAG